MSKHTEKAPLLPPASVDFNALNDACRAGKSAAAALKAAVIVPPKPKADETQPAPAA